MSFASVVEFVIAVPFISTFRPKDNQGHSLANQYLLDIFIANQYLLDIFIANQHLLNLLVFNQNLGNH